MKILYALTISLIPFLANATDLACTVRYLPGTSGSGGYLYLPLAGHSIKPSPTPIDAGSVRFNIEEIKAEIAANGSGKIYSATFDSGSAGPRVVADLVIAPVTLHAKDGPPNGELAALDIRIGRVRDPNSNVERRIKFSESYVSKAHASLSLIPANETDVGIESPKNGISDLTAVCRFE